MAKRTPPEERAEYRPVNEQLARSVLAHKPSVLEDGPSVEVPEVNPPAPHEPDEPTPEPARKPESSPQLKALSGGRRRTAKGTEPSREPIKSKRRELVREKRMLLTEREDELFEELVSGVAKNLRVKVKSSNVLRACLTLLLHVQDELLKQCRRMEPLQRPRYDEPTTIVAFEEELARIFDSAIRNTKSLD